MTQTTVIGLDLAKNIFHVHGVDSLGKKQFSKRLTRSELLPFMQNLASCTVAMEACSGSFFWAREIEKLGHRAKILPAQYVTPFVKRGKSDAIDAEAICTASLQEGMSFVPIKSIAHQAGTMLIKSRALLVRQRTRTISALRGHLAEVGLIGPKGTTHVPTLIKVIRDTSSGLPDCLRPPLVTLANLVEGLTLDLRHLDEEIAKYSRSDESVRRLMTIPGIGPLTAAALKAYVVDPTHFKSARHFAAWVGLTPRSLSTGGRPRSRGVSKMGNTQLRSLLVVCAFTLLREGSKAPESSSWIRRLIDRRPFKVAAVAVANRLARVSWALMRNGGAFEGWDMAPRR